MYNSNHWVSAAPIEMLNATDYSKFEFIIKIAKLLFDGI